MEELIKLRKQVKTVLNSLDKLIQDRPVCDNSACPHKEIIGLYHEILPEHRKVKVWNSTRKALLAQRWREYSNLDDWRGYFEYVAESPFLTGGNQRRWRPDLEWLIRPNNLTKVLEGKYHEESH